VSWFSDLPSATEEDREAYARSKAPSGEAMAWCLAGMIVMLLISVVAGIWSVVIG